MADPDPSVTEVADFVEGPARDLPAAGGLAALDLGGPAGGERSVAERMADEALIVDVEGYEGPLDLLLTLSRTQKVDLRRVSVQHLAEQYLLFVGRARELRIELAADYLVMAAWMAYLKSRLLLPADPQDEGPSAEDMAAHLAWQLERLSAMREVGAMLMARDQLSRDFFARGQPEELANLRKVNYTATLLDIMQAYSRIRTRDEFRPYAFDRQNIYTMEQALDRLRSFLGFQGDWTTLADFLPEDWSQDPKRRRSATAAHFAATLELAKQGVVQLQQTETFAPLRVRMKPPGGVAP